MINSRKQLQQQFWSGLEKVFHARGLEWPYNTPDHCKDFRMGKGGITLFICILPDEKKFKIGLALDGSFAEERFEELQRSKAEIESKLKLNLDWNNETNRIRRSVTYAKSAPDIEDRSSWRKHHDWMADILPRFQIIFKPYVDRL